MPVEPWGNTSFSITMERIHESLGYRTPDEIYVEERLNPKPVQTNTIHHMQPVFCLDNGEILICQSVNVLHAPYRAIFFLQPLVFGFQVVF